MDAPCDVYMTKPENMNHLSAYTIIRKLADGLIPAPYRRHVVAWLVGEEDHEDKSAALERIWEQTPEHEDEERLAEALDCFRIRRDHYENRMGVRRARIRLLKYAAMLAFPVVVGAVAWQWSAVHNARQHELTERYVAYGTTDSLTLSDGTKVRINAGSTLFYPRTFTPYASRREVYLEGEAHFDVARNKDCPFVVHTGKLSVRVLGTHFNVRAYATDEYITTTLEEGKVRVYDKTASADLLPGEQLVYNRLSGEMRKRHVDSDGRGNWMDGSLNFEQETLAQVLAELSRRYNVEFVVGAGIGTGRRYTMNFRSHESIGDVMTVLTKIAGNMTWQQSRNTIMLHSKKGGDR